jgi:diaminobutyrate-2-oxoglutarate transaminase
MWDETGNVFIDFLCGAGALNYGHNPDHMQKALLHYMSGDGIVQALDLHTAAKRQFIEAFEEVILAPRGLQYKIQFTGPTGTNAVEAALKLARKVTGRTEVACFSGAFHGMSLGSLSVSSNPYKRAAAGIPLQHAIRLPYEGFWGRDSDTIDAIRRIFSDPSSGTQPPAAFILETIQGEGGAIAAKPEWLKAIAGLAKELGSLLIVDDVQAGCGRSGDFFSFEQAALAPDIVCLSKSISGFGLPMAINLIRPELDVWLPGEHNGTFRGNTLAFVAAAATVDLWRDDALSGALRRRAAELEGYLDEFRVRWPHLATESRGRGMLRAIVFPDAQLARLVQREAFLNGLIVETCGADDRSIKLMPAITISPDDLEEGMSMLTRAVENVAEQKLIA